MHFYGRAAAGPSFSEGILRTFTAPRAATTFLGLDVISVNNMTERAAFLTHSEASCVQLFVACDVIDSSAAGICCRPWPSSL